MRAPAKLLPILAGVAGGQQREDYRVRVKLPRAAEVDRILVRADAFKDHWLGEQDYEAINAFI
ncbi:MAG: hypothetical protein FJW31_14735 [Acidobacteria bacterium]|nr:hypothetical protein [Acidobacteriota bacterium]